MQNFVRSQQYIACHVGRLEQENFKRREMDSILQLLRQIVSGETRGEETAGETQA
jgi:hypothetical protein